MSGTCERMLDGVCSPTLWQCQAAPAASYDVVEVAAPGDVRRYRLRLCALCVEIFRAQPDKYELRRVV